MCPRCSKIVCLNMEEQSFFIHCKNNYYKQVRGRKRVRQVCNFKISALRNTWFERASLDIVKICRLISYFLLLQSPRQLFLQEELSISSRTAVD